MYRNGVAQHGIGRWVRLIDIYLHDVEQYCDSGTGLACITQTLYGWKKWGHVMYDYWIYCPAYHFLPFLAFVGEGTSWSRGFGVFRDRFDSRKASAARPVSVPSSSPPTARFEGMRVPFCRLFIPSILRATLCRMNPSFLFVTVPVAVGRVAVAGTASAVWMPF